MVSFYTKLTLFSFPYRSEQEEKADIEEYAKKKNNVGLKKKVLPSLFAQDPEENLEAEREKKAGKSKNARRRRKRNELREAGIKVNFNVILVKTSREGWSQSSDPRRVRYNVRISRTLSTVQALSVLTKASV